MSESSLLTQLVDALKVLPGVGSKTAQRMALHLLERNREGGLRLAQSLEAAMQRIGHCQRCRTFTENELCRLCSNPTRDHSLLCVVETPGDVLALEQATNYQGVYFVLMGQISPLDGIGPEEVGLDVLEQRLLEGEVKEVILAMNPSVDGEITAHYIHELARKHGVVATRIAQGVPIGGELEYVDQSTLAHALHGRTQYNNNG